MGIITKGVNMNDVSITPISIAKDTPIRWTERLPICVYPSTNIINVFNNISNINCFMNNHIGVTISADAPLNFRLSTVEYFPTQFEINELEEFARSNMDMSKWLILIYQTPLISEMWFRFLTNYIRSGRKFGSVTVGIVQTPEIAASFTDYVDAIIVGNDYTEDSVFKYPIASLLMNITENNKKSFAHGQRRFPRIIAIDEELESINNTIKALALGADDVMLGKSIVKASESFGEVFNYDSGIGELIRFTDEQLPEGLVHTLKSSALKKYKPYRYLSTGGKAYEVSYSITEYLSQLRASLNEILTTTGADNIYKLRNNINVIIK